MAGFLEALRERVLLFDGAMGTSIQDLNPSPSDFPGGQDGFNDGLALTHPEWIKGIHEGYLKAGADCIETNSFGSNRIKLDEYGMGDKTVEINRKIAGLACEARGGYENRYVVGSMGPSGYLPSSEDPDLGRVRPETIREAFESQAEGLILGGVDALLIETSQDLLEVKLAIEACRSAISRSRAVPVVANVTLDQYGKMLLGTPVQAAYTAAAGMGIDVFGLNCSTGPDEMAQSVEWLDTNAGHDLLVVPNAGMPENEGGRAAYRMGPAQMASSLGRMLDKHRRVRVVGGCCGTGPAHIEALRGAIDERR